MTREKLKEQIASMIHSIEPIGPGEAHIAWVDAENVAGEILSLIEQSSKVETVYEYEDRSGESMYETLARSRWSKEPR